MLSARLHYVLLHFAVGRRVQLDLSHFDLSQKAWDQDASAVCSDFQAHASKQQCGGKTRYLDTLGEFNDRLLCAEACKHVAFELDTPTCCVYTDLNVCIAHVGSDHIFDDRSWQDNRNICLTEGSKYLPINMPRQSRTEASSVELCQQRCNEVSGCAHFSYWPNKGCHLQDSSALPKKVKDAVVAGPPTCEIDNPNAIAYKGSATVCTSLREHALQDERGVDWGFGKATHPIGLASAWIKTLFDEEHKVMTFGHGEALFRNVKPREIKQGGLGDCWLMSAIAAMARFPSAVRQLFLQQFRARDHAYSVRLYNLEKSQWEWVAIDDSIPSRLFGEPMFAQLAADRALWVLLLEKAVVKLVDPQLTNGEDVPSKGYSKLDGGFGEFGLVLLTGPQKHNIWKRSSKARGGEETERFIKATDVMWSASLRNEFPADVRWYYGSTAESMWKALMDATRDNRLMIASIEKGNESAELVREGETNEGFGLFGGHAYSLLRVKEVTEFNQVCIESIIVTYASRQAWEADAQFMENVWWSPGDSFRITGATWQTSRAVQHGVEDGWFVVDPGAFQGEAPTRSAPRKVEFRGVVDIIACDELEQQRTGRKTEFQSMHVTSLSGGTSLRLVQVRNPWGSSEMWTGAWSDTDKATWSNHLDIAEVVGLHPFPDGMWWMTFDDFVSKFDMWSVGGVNMLRFNPPRPKTATSLK